MDGNQTSGHKATAALSNLILDIFFSSSKITSVNAALL